MCYTRPAGTNRRHESVCGWSETQAAYRFLAQEEIGWEDILSPHFACTHERMRVLKDLKRGDYKRSLLPEE
jgi:hypothetical protein